MIAEGTLLHSSAATTQQLSGIGLLRSELFSTVVHPGFRSVADKALGCMSEQTAEEARLQTARRNIGASITHLSDVELESYITEFMYLVESWLDEYERASFDGLTLKQLIQE
jgi:hypothetical protein